MRRAKADPRTHEVQARLCSDDAHTVHWRKDITLNDGTILPAGRCNVYAYPTVMYTEIELDNEEVVTNARLQVSYPGLDHTIVGGSSSLC